jgi:coenzyme F420-reducing hydrogenase alpha subunit
MKFTEITSSITESKQSKASRVQKLLNERAALRNEYRKAIEAGDTERVDTLNVKLNRLTETIEALQESASPKVATRAYIAQLKRDLAELHQNPSSQEGYDARDELLAKIKKAESELASMTESGDTALAYQAARQQAVEILKRLSGQVDTLTEQHVRHGNDWGYVNAMRATVAKLQEISDSFGD